jgi:hypothetical protein
MTISQTRSPQKINLFNVTEKNPFAYSISIATRINENGNHAEYDAGYDAGHAHSTGRSFTGKLVYLNCF